MISSISIDTRQLNRRLNDLERRQLPFAMAMAINDTLSVIQAAEPAQIEKEIDRPTPFTKRKLQITRASKAKLSGRVGYRERQKSYLMIQATGGVVHKSGAGKLVPVKARLNKYGNMPRGAIPRALAKPNAFRGRVAGINGVWQRARKTKATKAAGSGLKLLAAFEPVTRYKARVMFDDRAAKLGSQRISPAFRARLKAAMATAR